jgi:sulfonate transport system substrate-binding protein
MVRLRTLFAVASFLAAVVLAGCSNQASTRAGADADAPTTTATPVTVPASIPAGTVLRVGDQLDYLKTILKVGGQDQDLPYEIEWSNFIGGPPMLQAFKGGSVDAGFVASTPLIFAQAAGQDITAVAAWAPEHGLGGVITTDKSVTDWADLEGKRIAYQRGTSAEAAVLSGLDAAGLTVDDITTVDVPITQVTAALQSGSADAGVSTEPLISAFLKDHPEASAPIGLDAITDRTSLVIASRATLDDDAKTAALADLLTRLVRSFDEIGKNRDLVIDAIFEGQYGLEPARAKELGTRSGVTTFLQLPGDLGPAQQKLADLFVAAGQIPREIDTDREFDTRFNDLIRTETGR